MTYREWAALTNERQTALLLNIEAALSRLGMPHYAHSPGLILLVFQASILARRGLAPPRGAGFFTDPITDASKWLEDHRPNGQTDVVWDAVQLASLYDYRLGPRFVVVFEDENDATSYTACPVHVIRLGKHAGSA